MSNPSCNSQTQVYWNGTSFFSATAFFSDSALTNPSPDGWYVFGGVVRQILNGVLLSAVPCDSCVIPCEDPITFGGGSGGAYTLNIGFGNKIGAAIITFSTGKSSSGYFPVPDMCTWEYNGNTSSEYSSLLGGYMKGLIGVADGNVWKYPKICFEGQSTQLLNASTGSNGFNPIGTYYNNYNQAIGDFDPSTVTGLTGSTIAPFGFTGLSNNTGQYQSTLLSWNCSDQTANNCTGGTPLGVPSSPYNLNLPLAPNLPSFSPGTATTGTSGTNWPNLGLETRGAVMVIPAPPNPISNVAKITITGPCFSTLWAIDIQCPAPLEKIPCSTEFGVLEFDQSQLGQDSKTPLYTTFMGSGTTSCGPFPNTLPCLNGKLTDDTVGVNFNNPILFPPVGVSIGDLVQDPATGFYATVTNVSSSGSVLTIENFTTGQDAVTAFAQTGVPYDVYRKGVCSYQLDKFIYHVPVDAWGNSNPNSLYHVSGDQFPDNAPTGQPQGVLGLGDWVFEDEYGVTPVAVGVYKTQFDANDGLGVRDWAVQVGPREYKDLAVSNTTPPTYPGGSTTQLNTLPPEDYVGQIRSSDWAGAGITFNDVQESGARVPGIVRSITPCDPPDSFDCDPVTFLCSDPGTGLGQYTSLADCNNNCTPPPSWDCDPVTFLCSDPGTGLGQYTSLADCNNNCTPPPSWDCVGGNCIDPGTGLGQYSTLSACNTACVPMPACGTPTSINGGSSSAPGDYSVTFDMGSITGATIIRFYPMVEPDRCTWTYDGVTASEYSSPTYGYLQGMIGSVAAGGSNPPCNPIMTNADGTNGLTYGPGANAGGTYAYNFGTGLWDNQGISITMGPYTGTNQYPGQAIDLTLSPGNNSPGYSMMVVPKPNALPQTVDLVIRGNCASTIWDMEVFCPVDLSVKDRGDLGGTCQAYTTVFYTASPHTADGLSQYNLQVHDWVFEDKDGVTPLPAGDYPARFPINPATGAGGPHKIMTVSTDGVITALVGC